ncbi:MAG TPA: hypothetical protein PKG49_10660 [Nitrosomonas mobilis]|nr:hypothetical protein [Nitrosomonas mobilis]
MKDYFDLWVLAQWQAFLRKNRLEARGLLVMIVTRFSSAAWCRS